jgi:6-phosphogluconolactonase
VSPDSKFVYVTGSGLGDLTTCSFEAGTGKLAVVGKPIMKNLKSVGPIAMDPKGQFLYVATADQTVTPPGAVYAYKRNASTGALTAIGKQVTYNKALAQAILVDASGKNCYVAGDATNSVYAYTIGATGALTPNTPSAAKTGQTPSALAIDATGKYAFAPCTNTDDLQMFTVDPANGALHDNGSRLAETQGDAPTAIVLVK